MEDNNNLFKFRILIAPISCETHKKFLELQESNGGNFLNLKIEDFIKKIGRPKSRKYFTIAEAGISCHNTKCIWSEGKYEIEILFEEGVFCQINHEFDE